MQHNQTDIFEQKSTPKQEVLFFSTTWMGTSFILGKILDQLQEEFQGAFEVRHIDVEEEVQLANTYHVVDIPTVIFLRDDTILDRFSGIIPRHELVRRVQTAFS